MGDKKGALCSSTCANLVAISEPSEGLALSFGGMKTMLIRTIYYRFTFMVPLFESFASKKYRKRKGDSVHRPVSHVNVQRFQVGDMVKVRPEEEIKASLDEDNRLKGLMFMQEMAGCCDKEFRVLKMVENMMIESTGELRKIKSPTYILEGAYCNGEYHKHCDRSCFFLWRGEWLQGAGDAEPKTT